HIVIFALLIMSPVSFSTSSIPNFYIFVTVNVPLQESRKNSITVAHRVALPLSMSACLVSPKQRYITLQALPTPSLSKADPHPLSIPYKLD
ncbi:MAG: hypothetical protein PHY09_14890, partial [Desulfuromonadaceae bacterium]|nr:hypothetical protein [Desulfuromonadaceae bacterium]